MPGPAAASTIATASPVPRSALDDALADGREGGVGVVTGVLDADETASIRAALWDAVDAEKRRGEELCVAAGVVGIDEEGRERALPPQGSLRTMARTTST